MTSFLLRLLLTRHLRFDAADPFWADRDRLVVASADAALAEHAALLLGAGPGLVHAVPQPIATATGLAVAERLLAARFGRSLMDHRSWVICDREELETGAAQEAAGLAGRGRLGRLTVLATMRGEGEAAPSGFAARGWSVRRLHDATQAQIDAAISASLRSFKPTLIACFTAQDPRAPGSADDPAGWAGAGDRGAGGRRAWLKRLARHASRQEFEQAFAGRLPVGWQSGLANPAWLGEPGIPASTLQAMRLALLDVGPAIPGAPSIQAGEAVCGAADQQMPPGDSARLAPAILAGQALHGGLLPIAIQPLGAADRVRPALTEAARHGVRLVTLLVEPRTPCPVAGQRAGLRAMRNLAVFRPADATEAVECLDLALRRTGGPSVLLVSEMPVAVLAARPTRTRVARGGYLVEDANLGEVGREVGREGVRDVTLISSGPDLHVALAARAVLAQAGVAAAIVSLPCWTLFAAQDAAWQAHILGQAPRVAIEAGSGFGWERWLGGSGLFLSLSPVPGEPCGGATAACTRVVTAVRRHLGLQAA